MGSEISQERAVTNRTYQYFPDDFLDLFEKPFFSGFIPLE